MPVHYGDRLVAWLDPKLDRRAHVLTIGGSGRRRTPRSTTPALGGARAGHRAFRRLPQSRVGRDRPRCRRSRRDTAWRRARRRNCAGVSTWRGSVSGDWPLAGDAVGSNDQHGPDGFVAHPKLRRHLTKRSGVLELADSVPVPRTQAARTLVLLSSPSRRPYRAELRRLGDHHPCVVVTQSRERPGSLAPPAMLA